jgi:decaprenylphospho-beta-D-erythro-pentofuranosid-2-ulose 2-reductase
MEDAFGQPQSAVVLGGTSDIARAIVRALVRRRCRTVVLAGRDTDRLAAAAAESEAAGADRVERVAFDAAQPLQAPGTVERCFEAAGEVDLVLVAVGDLSRRSEELDARRSAHVATVTYAWPVAAITRAAGLLVEQGHGRIVVLSSIAGVRIRRANFVYGSAKAGLDAFCLVLGEALAGTGVTVQVVRPGFVRSRMTVGMPAAPFATTPDAVAAELVRALESRAAVVWVPPALRWVSVVVRALPRPLWRRVPG